LHRTSCAGRCILKNSTSLHIVTHAFTEAFDYLLSEASRQGVSDIHFAPRAIFPSLAFHKLLGIKNSIISSKFFEILV
jgi:hypothetical protein